MGHRWENLIQAAMEARNNAYTPYSLYKVGAALLCDDGKIYTGCNIENASYPVSCCAERTALFKGVSEGRRNFAAIVVVGAREGAEIPFGEFAFPCGVCRQALFEFSPELTVVVAKSMEEYRVYTLRELLPNGFGGANLV